MKNNNGLNPNIESFSELGIYTKVTDLTKRITNNLKLFSKMAQHSVGEKIYNGFCEVIVLANRAYRESEKSLKYKYALRMRDAFYDMKILLKFCSDIRENIHYENYIMPIGEIERQINGWIISLEKKVNEESAIDNNKNKN